MNDPGSSLAVEVLCLAGCEPPSALLDGVVLLPDTPESRLRAAVLLAAPGPVAESVLGDLFSPPLIVLLPDAGEARLWLAIGAAEVLAPDELDQLPRVIMREAMRHRARRPLEALLAENAAYVIALDPDFRIRWVNRARPELRVDPVGRVALEFVDQPQHGMVSGVWNRVLRTGRPEAYEVPVFGHSAWYRTSVGPIRHRGRIGGVCLVVHDISAEKRNEGEAAAERAERLRDVLPAEMAESIRAAFHNIGNMMTSLAVSTTVAQRRLSQSTLGQLRVLASDIGSMSSQQSSRALADVAALLEQQHSGLKDLLATIHKRTAEITEILHSQQTLARPVSGESPTPVNAIIEDALAQHRHTATRIGAKIEREFAKPDMPVRRPSALLQILSNFIKNAVDAVADADQPRILVRTAIMHGLLRIEVSDNGHGFDDQAMARLYDDGFTTKADGQGLGLPFCRRTAIELGGSIEAASGGPGMGATFAIVLPASA